MFFRVKTLPGNSRILRRYAVVGIVFFLLLSLVSALYLVNTTQDIRQQAREEAGARENEPESCPTTCNAGARSCQNDNEYECIFYSASCNPTGVWRYVGTNTEFCLRQGNGFLGGEQPGQQGPEPGSVPNEPPPSQGGSSPGQTPVTPQNCQYGSLTLIPGSQTNLECGQGSCRADQRLVVTCNAATGQAQESCVQNVGVCSDGQKTTGREDQNQFNIACPDIDGCTCVPDLGESFSFDIPRGETCNQNFTPGVDPTRQDEVSFNLDNCVEVCQDPDGCVCPSTCQRSRIVQNTNCGGSQEAINQVNKCQGVNCPEEFACNQDTGQCVCNNPAGCSVYVGI